MQKIITELNPEQIEEFRDYLYERENAQATIQKYVTDIRTLFRYLGENRTLDKQRLLAYKEWLLEGYAVNSVNSILAALNRFLEFLGLGSMRVRRIRVQKSLFLQEERELTRKEYQKLLETAYAAGKYQLALCMETIFSTGVRVSELSFFTVESIKKDYIEIINKGKYRRIYLPQELKRKLIRFSREEGIRKGPVFVTRTGKPKSRSNIWREMKALKEKAGIDGRKIFPHNLRHLFARTYYAVTRDLAGLGDLLGHSSLNVTRVYTSDTGKNCREQLELMNRMKMEMGT